jgi:indole-3-glycerol phosphate synthase
MNILETIVDHKRTEISTRKRDRGLAEFRDMPHFTRAVASLRSSVLARPPLGIIAEIKRSSPSAGTLNRIISPAAVAAEYEANGAAGCSVLTDERFFGGTLDDLAAVRAATSLPILRKEFIIDEYQIAESKAYGADAILLIAAILEPSQIAEYHLAAAEIGMETLIELYDPREIDKLDLDAHLLVGVNNRDLRTFAVDVQRSADVAAIMPEHVTLISESGLGSAADLRFLIERRIRGALIGEYFMRSASPGAALRQLLEAL